jgi:hypothetical protein
MARLVMSPAEKAGMIEGLKTAREVMNTARTDIPNMEGKIPVAIRKRMDVYFGKIDEIMEAAIMYSENYVPRGEGSSTSKTVIHKRIRDATPEQLAAIDAILRKEEEEEAIVEEITEE